MKAPTFMAYRRENGKVGVRNHVLILPVDDISNAACEAVANQIKGTLAIPHAYGRLQFGEDLELFFRTMIGTGRNPNVAAVVVIGIEPDWTDRIVKGIAETGKPVTGFFIERSGDLETVRVASHKAMEYVQWATQLQKTECSMDELYISVKCGESDTTSGLASNPTIGNVIDKHIAMGGTASFGETSELTGAEHIVREMAATPEVGELFRIFNDPVEKIKSLMDSYLKHSHFVEHYRRTRYIFEDLGTEISSIGICYDMIQNDWAEVKE